MPPWKAPPPRPAPHNTQSLEKEKELRQFLKLARPEWLVPRRKGLSDVNRVILKLRAIGITDTDSLLAGIDKNTINGALNEQGYVPFSRETIDSIRLRKPFMQALKDAEAPHTRQTGQLAPVPQMLAKRRLNTTTSGSPSSGDSPSAGASLSLPGLGTSRSEVTLREVAGTEDLESGAMSCDGQDRTAFLPRLRGAKRTRKRRAAPAASITASDIGSLRGESTRGDVLSHWDGDGADSATSEEGLFENLLLISDSTSSATRRPVLESTSVQESSPTNALRPPEFAMLPESPKASSQRRPHVADATASSPAGSSSVISPLMRARGSSCSAVGHKRSLDEAKDWVRLGADMLRADDGRNFPKWSPLHEKSPSRLGEEMLEEQVALEERQRLIRTVSNIHGEELAFRNHVAQNIRKRLQEESRREGGRGPALAMDHQCIKIRKELDHMAKARGELRGLRSKVQAFTEPGDNAETMLETSSGGGTSKRKSHGESPTQRVQGRRAEVPPVSAKER